MEIITDTRVLVQDNGQIDRFDGAKDTPQPNELYPVQDTGQILQDGKNDFKSNKLKSLAVSRVLPCSNPPEIRRTQRMFQCGDFLTFMVNEAKDMRLYKANFCRDRMCPACQQRRSRVVFHQVKDVCNSIVKAHPTYKYLLLTLTVPNVPIEDLNSKILEMGKAWLKLSRRVIFKKSVKGWFRTIEITYNAKTNTYHPHYHILLCVPSNYFTKNYIAQSKWLELWQDVMNDYSITQVDIRKIKPNPKKTGSDAISSASAEVGKYATKPSDYLKKTNTVDEYIADSKVVNELAKIIKGKKLIAFGGLMLEHVKLLDLQDVDESDLIKTGDEEESFKGVYTHTFHWNIGFTNYIG